MDYNFFQHPLWRKYHNRPIWVITLSESEHRLRDARAILALSEFLPPKVAGTTFASVTVTEGQATGWPKIPDDAGIVVLGRPSLFGLEAESLLNDLTPPMYYKFKSNDRESTDYRTITCLGQDFDCQTFLEQKQAEPSPKELTDKAIVYSGWHRKRPVTMLSGTSTVGTWGAVHYVTSLPPAADVRWQPDFQGVVEAAVRNRADAFDTVRSTGVEVLAPVRLWVEGSGFPPTRGWAEAILRLEEEIQRHSPKGKTKRPRANLQLFANGIRILKKSRDYVSAAILLAWLDTSTRQDFDGGFCAWTTSSELTKRLHDLFDCQLPDRDKFQMRVVATLDQLTAAIREQGGMVFNEELPQKTDSGKGMRRFLIVSRDLPFFLQDTRL